MLVPYLQPVDCIGFGVPNATPAQVQQASLLIDGYLKRPKGLVWVADSTGRPSYMANATPDMTWVSAAAIQPGDGVVVPVTGAPIYPEIIGRVVVLDQGSETTCETCIITAINTPTLGTITLHRVQFEHTTLPVQLLGGLQIFEERSLPQDRSISRVGQWPIANVISGLGRYSYGRRSQQVEGNYSEFNLLAILQQFGGPPSWVPLDTQQLGVNPITGELWIPAGLLLAYYSDVRLYYVAGWQQSDIPFAIKQACANIISGMSASVIGNTALKAFSVAGVNVQRFAPTNIDDDTKQMLNPYRSRLWA
jgi:hypothetical protein